jgi:hypothetical protein
MPSKSLLSAVLPLTVLLGGCNATLWGNLLVLGVTIGIFFGTLSLGRSSTSTIRSAERSAPSQASRS